MRAYLTFQVITVVLLALVKVTGLRERLSAVADDQVVTIGGVVALLLLACALTILVLRFYRGWSPE